MRRLLPVALLAAACSPATPASTETPPAVQPSNATFGTDANLAASAPQAVLRYADVEIDRMEGAARVRRELEQAYGAEAAPAAAQ